jgi:N-methylhydantoinase A/oxoprolinase/acetone carboxylase beta subunit
VKLKVVACGVFEPELAQLAAQSANEIDLVFLDAGLHSVPNTLREQAQAEIDAAVGQGYDTVVLGYGLCGRGTSGLIARHCPVVIPRVHDCMTLFLGSREEYRRQFARHPGTFYTTPGWYEKKSLGAADERKSTKVEDVRKDSRFPELTAKYGEANAEYIIYFHDSWKRNYTRAAFIDTGVGGRERYERYAQQMAEDFGWRYERLDGSTELLADLLAGRWDDERIFVLQPGQRSMLTGDERIFAAVDVRQVTRDRAQVTGTATASLTAGLSPRVRREEADAAGRRSPSPVLHRPSPSVRRSPSPVTRHLSPAVTGLGIDAGGTYTDCVVYDLKTDRVLAKAKALTTHHDLMLGINEGLDRLGIPDPFPPCKIAALSTTLATNSIVEGKGGRPGAIVMCDAIGAPPAIDWQPLRIVKGAMSITGVELAPPDRDEIARVVDELLVAGIDAFAVSGYASVTNPAHELIVKQIIRERCDLPIICGHELCSRLNYVSRANTAILNARLLPVVARLIESVEASLWSRGIAALLMVVKGDGSLISREVALERPIETILSGPAASVAGAKHLTGLQDAIILDMGGTTTDTALVEDGLVTVNPDGARVGGWLTSVEAADISTIGLGGDSYLSFTEDRKLLIGPRRVIPLAYLCERHPEAKRSLLALDPALLLDRSTPSVLDFFVLARPDYAGALEPTEARAIDALRRGPLSRDQLGRRLGFVSPLLVRFTRLEGLGVIQRSALTPTDLLHVTGEFRAWDSEAAEHGLVVFASLFGASPNEMIARVRRGIVERLAGQIINKEVPGACSDDPAAWPPLLRSAFEGNGRLRASLSYTRPIVAIGAPVEPFFPQVGAHLGAEVVIPEHADVANAIGAITSEVVVRERAVVRPGEIVNYVVHSRAGRDEYEDLLSAVESAKEHTAALALERALRAGTTSRDVKHLVRERRAFTAEGEEMLVEVVVEASVSGRPAL